MWKCENPFEAEGKWFKGNTHLHTSQSDGGLTLEEAAQLYRRHNYDFFVVTDHGRITVSKPHMVEGLLVIPGAEYSCEGIHIVGIGISEEAGSLCEHGVQRLIDGVVDQGGLAVIAHPYWSSLTVERMLALERYIGIEVYNTNCEREIGKGLSSVHWDYMLMVGKKCWGLAADDSHFRFIDYCGGWINVKAPRLDAEELLKSLEKGFFYSSSGPEIRNVELLDWGLRIECSPSIAVRFVCDRSRGGCVHRVNGEYTAHRCEYRVEDGYVVEASYRLRGKERYVRVEIVDEKGGRAWSNPFFIMEERGHP